MEFSFSEVLIYNVRLNFVLWTPRSKTFHIEIESICENASACLYHTNYVVKIMIGKFQLQTKTTPN